MIERYSVARLATPIDAEREAGIAPALYTVRTGRDTGYPDAPAVVNLAIRHPGPEIIALVEAAIPALLARGFHVERGIDATGRRGRSDLHSFWDEQPGALTDCHSLQPTLRPDKRNVEVRPGMWPRREHPIARR